MMIGRSRSLIKVAIALAIIMVAVPVLGAIGFSFDGGRTVIDSITLSGCTLDIRVNHLDPGTFRIDVVDDSVTRFSQSYVQGGAGSFLGQYIITGRALPGAVGIGVLVYRNNALVAIFDGFTYADATGTTCRLAAEALVDAQCADTAGFIPAGSVVGALPFGGRAYWAPGKITPNVTLNPGTYWVLNVEYDDDTNRIWNQILLSCQRLWVPAEWMGPNYDNVWRGTPLPSVSNLSATQLAEVQAAMAESGQ